MKENIGRTVKGIIFEYRIYGRFPLSCIESMHRLEGEEGTITDYTEKKDQYIITFLSGDFWYYPASLINKQFENTYMEQYIGKIIKGFKFKNSDYSRIGYIGNMNKYINQVGKITSYCESLNSFKVTFNNSESDSDFYSYPADLVIEQLNNTVTDMKQYKLKDSSNQEACEKITGYDFNFSEDLADEGESSYYAVATGTSCYNRIVNANLLDLWFEEVKEDFKVGDYVVLVTNLHMPDKENMYSYDKKLSTGKVYKINSLENSAYPFKYWVHINDNTRGGISANQFRLATKSEIEEFNKRNSMPKIDSYIPRVYSDDISYGCIRVSKKALKEVLNCATIEEITVLVDGDLITIDSPELNQMKEYLNNN